MKYGYALVELQKFYDDEYNIFYLTTILKSL